MVSASTLMAAFCMLSNFISAGRNDSSVSMDHALIWTCVFPKFPDSDTVNSPGKISDWKNLTLKMVSQQDIHNKGWKSLILVTVTFPSFSGGTLGNKCVDSAVSGFLNKWMLVCSASDENSISWQHKPATQHHLLWKWVTSIKDLICYFDISGESGLSDILT